MIQKNALSALKQFNGLPIVKAGYRCALIIFCAVITHYFFIGLMGSGNLHATSLIQSTLTLRDTSLALKSTGDSTVPKSSTKDVFEIPSEVQDNVFGGFTRSFEIGIDSLNLKFSHFSLMHQTGDIYIYNSFYRQFFRVSANGDIEEIAFFEDSIPKYYGLCKKG